jgi:hypothetical protein
MGDEKSALQSARQWVVDHKLRTVGTFCNPHPMLASSLSPLLIRSLRFFLFVLQGTLWLSAIVGSIA